MVYMGNIIKAHDKLNYNEAICLLTKSNRKIIIEKKDTLTREAGDLKIIKPSMCYCYLDCAEVETCIVSKIEIIRGE